MGTKKIALIGEYNPDFSSHQATNAAIQHSNKKLGTDVEGIWISTENINLSIFDEYSGIWIAPGSPYKNMDKTLMAIRYAREHNVPCLGTCGGFQHIVIEYARNILGYQDAQHAEYDPYASNLFISPLTCSLFGKEMKIQFVPESNIAKIYSTCEAMENYYCNFGVNPNVTQLFKHGSMRIVSSDSGGEIRAVEIQSHPFFIGTLFVPQNRSTVINPHPLITAFLRTLTELT